MNTENGEPEGNERTMGAVFQDTGLPSFFLGAAGLYALWLVVQSIVVSGWWEAGSPKASLGGDLAALGIYVALVAMAAVQFVRRKTRVSHLWAPDSGEAPLAWGWGVGLTLVSLAATIVIAVADDGIRAAWFPAWRDQTTEFNFASPLTWLITVLWAPVVEELVFRGYLLHRWARRGGTTFALIATSALFALLHPNPVGHFLGALVLGIVTLKTGSLTAAVGIHLGNNLLAMLIGWTAQAAEPAASDEALTGVDLGVAVVLALGVMGWFARELVKYWPRKGRRVLVVEGWKENWNTENGETETEGKAGEHGER